MGVRPKIPAVCTRRRLYKDTEFPSELSPFAHLLGTERGKKTHERISFHSQEKRQEERWVKKGHHPASILGRRRTNSPTPLQPA